MKIFKPMLAKVLKNQEILPGKWRAERKYDGHRIKTYIAETGGNLFRDPEVEALSRNDLPRELPKQIVEVLEKFPSCILDNELFTPGAQSTNVTHAANENPDSLVLAVFDVIELLGQDVRNKIYDERRSYLEEIFKTRGSKNVVLAESWEVNSMEDVIALRDQVYSEGGEGLILKRRSSLYHGKRTDDWLKIKELQQGRGVLVGFLQGELGPHSRLVVRDMDGQIVRMKWKNFDMLADFKTNGTRYVNEGRQLFFEYQHRADDGGYRHPRFDRWVEDGE